MTARVSMLLKSRASPDILPFSLCNKKKTCNSSLQLAPLSNDTIDSVSRHREVGRTKNLSAPPRMCRLGTAAAFCVSGSADQLINTALCIRSYFSQIMFVTCFCYCHCFYFNCYYCFKNKRNSGILLTDEWFQIVKGKFFCYQQALILVTNLGITHVFILVFSWFS